MRKPSPSKLLAIINDANARAGIKPRQSLPAFAAARLTEDDDACRVTHRERLGFASGPSPFETRPEHRPAVKPTAAPVSSPGLVTDASEWPNHPAYPINSVTDQHAARTHYEKQWRYSTELQARFSLPSIYSAYRISRQMAELKRRKETR